LFGNRRLPGLTIQLALWAICFLGATTSGLIVGLLHRRFRNAMLLTSAGALLGWALIAIMLLKRGALQQPPTQIAGATIVYYLVALTGFMIGGFLFTPAPQPAAPTACTLRPHVEQSKRAQTRPRVTLGEPKRVTLGKRRRSSASCVSSR